MDGGNGFAAEPQVHSSNASAEVEVVVSDFTDEAHVVSIAQHTPHAAMTVWGRVTSGRFSGARAGDLPSRGTPRRRWAREGTMSDDARAEDPDRGWTVKLEKVQRTVPMDPDEPEDGDLFRVEFELSGPDMDVSVEVPASDVDDESQVVVEAPDALQDGLRAGARLLGRRRGAERIEPTEGRSAESSATAAGLTR